MSPKPKNPHRSFAGVAGAALILAAVILVGFFASLASGKAARELGATARTPNPLCPKDCRVTGTVTAMQVTAGGKDGLFKVPSDGHIVAWAVDLGDLSPEDIASANDKFKNKSHEGRSVGRLALLKPAERSRYKLTKQSPVVELEPSFGRRPIFTLNNPIRVKKGLRIALTLPTWAPVYRDGLSTDKNQWVASRQPDECEEEKLLDAQPQQKIGSVRSYGCRFTGERILYWAYFVADG